MLIEEIMSRKVETLYETNTIKDAHNLMRDKKIRHIPILNKEDKLVGIVTDRDLKEAVPSRLIEKQFEEVYENPIKGIMIEHPITAHPMDFVEESAVIFYDKQIGCLPVISNGQLVGIITETDLLYKYIELTGANQPGSQIEVGVPNVPGSLFEVAKVFHEHQTNVLSVLVYPDKKDDQSKILVIRFKTMNPLPIIKGLRTAGFTVLWPNVPGIDV